MSLRDLDEQGVQAGARAPEHARGCSSLRPPGARRSVTARGAGWVIGVVLALEVAACGPDAVRAGAPSIQAFAAAPASPRPGDPVRLVAVFTGGGGRIEPGVGAVESGREVSVGLLPATRTYTLVVTSARDPAVEARRELVVPLEYRHQLAPRPASPSARTGHAAATLADGSVLVAGGSSTGPTGWATADLVDPATGAHTPAGDLWTARVHAAAVALPDGGALLVGGDTDVNDRRSVERWTPITGTFSRLGDLLESRTGHTATLLAGGLVLVAGGDAFLGAPAGRHTGAELYDPESGVSRPSAGGDMIQARYGHTATLLPDGRVLVVGGWDASSGAVAVSAEIFDPSTETFSLAGTLRAPRGGHSAVLLPDGRVLVAGGGDLEPTASAEAWVPSLGVFTPAGGLATPRWDQQAVLLGSGEVLVLGGTDAEGRALASAETWTPTEATFTARGDVLKGGRRGFVLAPLPDGRVLVHGGEPGDGFPVSEVGAYE